MGEKRETVQECDAADENIKKIEKKKKKLENFLASYSTEANTNIAKLQKEIDSLQRMLREPDKIPTVPIESEVMTKANPELLQSMERQIEAVEKELECPICLEVASQAPILKCVAAPSAGRSILRVLTRGTEGQRGKLRGWLECTKKGKVCCIRSEMCHYNELEEAVCECKSQKKWCYKVN